MTLILLAMALLGAGGVISAATSFRRAPSLALGLGAVIVSGVLCAGEGLRVLGGGRTSDATVEWPLPLGTFVLSMDGLSAWFLVVIGLVSIAAAIYSWGYFGGGSAAETPPAYAALLCAMNAAMVLVVCAGDAVLFLLGWELMSVSAFLLCSARDRSPGVRRGAWMYLIATHIGTALCVVPLMGILVAGAHTTAFESFPPLLAGVNETALSVLFALGVVGFGAKAGFFPIHIWLPAAHPVAPTPVSALLSGVVIKTGIYGLLRLLSWMPPLPQACGYALVALGIASGLMGVLYALAQHDLKCLLAYHTVENIGIIMLGIGVGMLGQTLNAPVVSILGYTGALLHVLNHALFKGLLFLSAGAVLHDTGTVEIERLGGLARSTPLNASMFLIGSIAICGLPPLNGFVSEWVIYSALFTSIVDEIGGSDAAPALAILGLALMGGLALACFAKVLGVVFLGQPRDRSLEAHPTPPSMRLAMAALAIACVAIGVAPGLWVPFAYPAAGTVLGLPAEGLDYSVHEVFPGAWSRFSLLALILLSVAAGLVLLRGLAMLRSRPATAATWGCAYARPSARMQYSATSFASPLIHSFKGLLWPEREYAAPSGVFPEASRLESHVADLAEKDVFSPLFRRMAAGMHAVRTVSWGRIPARAEHAGPIRTLASNFAAALRRGSVHVCMLFIVITLVVLFVAEGFSAGTREADRDDPRTPHADGLEADR